MTISHIKFDFLNSYQEVVDESIKLVMKKRHVKSQVRGLTEHDLFFREVCFYTCKLIIIIMIIIIIIIIVIIIMIIIMEFAVAFPRGGPSSTVSRSN